MWFLLFIASFGLAMEQPEALQLPVVKRYPCCPRDFGYLYLGIDSANIHKELIRIGDPDETRICDDDRRSINLNHKLFKCLVIELSKQTDLGARESFEHIVERLRTARIRIVGKRVWLTRKDLFNRLFAHLPGCKEGDQVSVLLKDTHIGFTFVPCIHNFNQNFFNYYAHLKDELFGAQMRAEFEQINPFPSLIALSLRVVRKHKTKEGHRVLPLELKLLLES